MTENMKRKITVEPSTSKSKDTLRRPSVFERLGTKASATSNAAPPSTGKEGASSACRHWAQSGSCPYGKNCKNAVTHILISPSKQRAAKKDETKVKTTGNTGNTLLPLKPGSILKDDINKRLHSMVVKKSRTGGSPDMNWENWDQTDLEYEDEKVLEKRRQLLQRELELQMSREKSEQKTKKVKKVKKGVSSSSSTSASSSSSTESTSSSDDSSSTSSSTSTDSRRKKTKTKSGKRASSSSTSGADRAAAKKKAAKAANAASPSGGKKTQAARKDEQKSAPAASSKRRASPASKKPAALAVAPSATKKRSATPSSRPRRRSATPQRSTDKDKAAPTGKKPATRQNQSPVARRASSLDKKDKGNQGASPRTSARDREREKIKDKDREKDKEREKEKERGKGQGAGRSRSPAKGKGKDRPASPRRNSRPRDPRRKDSPAAGGSKDNKGGRASTPGKSRPRSPSRGRGRDGSGERKTAASKISPGVALSNDRRDGNRNDSRDARDRDNGSKKNDYDNRKGDAADKGPRGKEPAVNRGGGNRLRDEPVNNRRDGDSASTRDSNRKIVPPKSVSDRDFKGDKDRTGGSKDPRSNSRDARDNRDNVDPRLPRNPVQNLREMREADREKEREEALERCRERQRERDRKAREDKAREDKAREEKLARENEKAARDHQKAAREHERELPSLLMISTRNPIKSNSSQSNGGREGSKGLDKGSERGSDRSHDKERVSDKDRDLDKSKSFDRDRGIDRDRGSNRGLERDRPGDRDRGLDRGMPDRERPPDRDRVSDRASDRGHDRDRGFDRGPEHDRVNDRDRAGPPERDRVGPDRDRVGPERDRAPERERPFERERNDRPPAKGPHDRGPNRAIPDRAYDRGLDRGFDREAERGGGFDRGHLESERDYPRGRDDCRRPPPEEKGPGGFDSPYDARRGREERGRYGEQMERGGRYEDQGPPRDEQRRSVGDNRPFQDDRRGGRRDGRTSLEPQWETRNDPDSRRRPPGYDREEPRSPGPAVKGRDWDARDYPDGGRREWDGRGPRRGPPLDWDNQRRGEWIDKDAAHPPIEDDWDVYAGVNAPGDWGAGGGEGWPPPDDWERPPPRSALGRQPPPRLPPHRDEVPGGGGYVQPPLRDIKLEEPPPEEGKELPPASVSSVEKLAPMDDPAAPAAPAAAAAKVPAEVSEPPAGGLKRPRESSDGEGDKPEPKRVCLEDSLPLEEDLSDISDDDADEILNREDVEVAIPVEPLVLAPAQPPANVSAAAGGEMPRSLADHEPERMERPAVAMTIDSNRDSSDQQSLLPQDEDTMDNLDFEEISDEELEEEAKAGLGDALGVDWASLVAESRPRVRTEASPGSGRRRWEGCHMLARLGISFEYAGPELVDRVTAQLKAASAESKGEEEELALLHPVALIHVALREKRERRKALFASAGPYKRALSARRDLMIRRQLCNLPGNETTVDGQGANAEDVYRHAVQLFVRGLA